MFANTLTLTINAVAKTLTRINQDKYGSEYQFKDGTEKIVMKIRHDVVTFNSLPTNRHNVQVDHTVYATPTVLEKYYSVAFTIRDREGSGPTPALYLIQAMYTLVATLDDGLVVGEN